MISFKYNYKENYDKQIRSCIDDMIEIVIDNTYEYYKTNKISNFMLIDKRLDDYKQYLENTIYIDDNNILNIPLGSYIIYFTKNNLKKRSGFLVKIINDEIYKIKNYNKVWIIYVKKYYIFYKEPIRDRLRHILDKIITNDFKIKKKNNNNH